MQFQRPKRLQDLPVRVALGADKDAVNPSMNLLTGSFCLPSVPLIVEKCCHESNVQSFRGGPSSQTYFLPNEIRVDQIGSATAAIMTGNPSRRAADALGGSKPAGATDEKPRLAMEMDSSASLQSRQSLRINVLCPAHVDFA